MTLIQRLIFKICLISLLFTAPLHVVYADDFQPVITQAVSLGVVPQFRNHRMREIWNPIKESLEKETGLTIYLVIPKSISIFEKHLLAGEFDFAYMNPYQALISNKAQGYLPFAYDKKNKLQGIIVARKNGNIHSISQLNNKVLAFPDSRALGASLLIQAELNDKFDIKVEGRYVGSHDNVYFNVLQNYQPAGGGIQKTLDSQPYLLRNKLKVIYKTQAISSHPFAAHPRINKDTRERFYRALYSMSQTTSELNKLVRIPVSSISPASLDDYSVLSDMRLERFYYDEK
jgi:ABC-type phosphate/phosphonate transport system substrate-binding protein